MLLAFGGQLVDDPRRACRPAAAATPGAGPGGVPARRSSRCATSCLQAGVEAAVGQRAEHAERGREPLAQLVPVQRDFVQQAEDGEARGRRRVVPCSPSVRARASGDAPVRCIGSNVSTRYSDCRHCRAPGTSRPRRARAPRCPGGGSSCSRRPRPGRWSWTAAAWSCAPAHRDQAAPRHRPRPAGRPPRGRRARPGPARPARPAARGPDHLARRPRAAAGRRGGAVGGARRPARRAAPRRPGRAPGHDGSRPRRPGAAAAGGGARGRPSATSPPCSVRRAPCRTGRWARPPCPPAGWCTATCTSASSCTPDAGAWSTSTTSARARRCGTSRGPRRGSRSGCSTSTGGRRWSTPTAPAAAPRCPGRATRGPASTPSPGRWWCSRPPRAWWPPRRTTDGSRSHEAAHLTACRAMVRAGP